MPSCPGDQTIRRSARRECTATTGAPSGPAIEPSQPRNRTGSSVVPSTTRSASASRSATVRLPAISHTPCPWRQPADARDPLPEAGCTAQLSRATPDGRLIIPDFTQKGNSSGRRGGVLGLDQRRRGDPVDGERAALPASFVEALQEAAGQRDRLDDALAAAALG